METINDELLLKLNFYRFINVFNGKSVWGWRIKFDEIGNQYPLVEFDKETNICTFSNSEFCIIKRKCATIQEIEKFIDCIKYLFLE